MARFLAGLLALGLAAGAAAAVLYFRPHWLPFERAPAAPAQVAEPSDAWLDGLYSSNPQESTQAAHDVEQLGKSAVPIIVATLRDPSAGRERVKAALKACSILGKTAAPAIADAAAQLPQPEYTAEAALALSFMGREAFGPLREALSSEDPVVRRESLRSIGKLKARAPLDARAVVPLLVQSTQDADAGVRTVAATYLGILHEGGADAVATLVAGLRDPESDVRRASATALGSFGADAAPAMGALRRAMGDADPDVAREAGVALVKLQAEGVRESA